MCDAVRSATLGAQRSKDGVLRIEVRARGGVVSEAGGGWDRRARITTRVSLVPAEAWQTVSVEISGASGGQWILLRGEQRWTLCTGESESATTRIRLANDTAWRRLFDALPAHDVAA